MITVGIAQQIQMVMWLTESPQHPCLLAGLAFMISSQVELVVFFVRTWQLRCHLKVSESLDRQRLLSSETSSADIPNSQLKNWYLVNRRYFSIPFIKRVVCAHVSLVVIVIVISFIVDSEHLQTTAPCTDPYSVLLTMALFCVVLGYGLLFIITLSIRSITKDAYGIKQEFLCTFGCISIMKAAYLIVSLAGPEDSEGTSIASIMKYFSAFVHYAAMTVFSFVIPVSKTFLLSRTRTKTIMATNHELFYKILASEEDAEPFLVFLKREFSAENLLFDQAVQEHKKAPTLERATFIVENYVEQNSLYEVNISDAGRIRVLTAFSELCPASTSEECGVIFDEAQKEVRALMFRDSFPRFIASQTKSL